MLTMRVYGNLPEGSNSTVPEGQRVQGRQGKLARAYEGAAILEGKKSRRQTEQKAMTHRTMIPLEPRHSSIGRAANPFHGREYG